MSNATLLREVAPYINLHRCNKTGIAWVENGSVGISHSCHPNIHVSGSVEGMKHKGYWRREDRCVKSHGFIYNIDRIVANDELDQLAQKECRCAHCSTLAK